MNTINILHPRLSVGKTLKLCLFNSNYEDIVHYQSLAEFLRLSCKSGINLIDSKFLDEFLNHQQGDIAFSLLVNSDSDNRIIEALYAGATSFINISKGPAHFVNHIELIAENKVDEPSQLIRYFFTDKVDPLNSFEEETYNLTKKEKEF